MVSWRLSIALFSNFCVASLVLYDFVVPILESCFTVSWSAINCQFQLLERKVHAVSWLVKIRVLYPRFTVAGLCMPVHMQYTECVSTSEVHSNPRYCLYGELLPACRRHTRVAAAAHPYEFEVMRCRTSQFLKMFSECAGSRVCSVFNSGTSNRFEGAVKVKSSMARSLPVENLLPQNMGSIINYLQ